VHGTRATLAKAAAELGACEAEILAEHPQKRHLGADVYVMPAAVDLKNHEIPR
jgi:hypothetical protein